MSQEKTQDQLWLMLGEMRGDLKYLVNERRSTIERIATVEADTAEAHKEMNTRVTRLETFKTKIGVVTVALGAVVPTGIAYMAHKLGILS